MSLNPVIRVEDLTLYYGKNIFSRRGFTALDSVSLEVHAGETLGLIGSNGSGKSSLLRVLAGIAQPDAGSVETFGNSVSLLSLQVGFAPQLTGRENALLSGMFLGLSRARVKENMARIIEFTGLDEFIDEPLAVYSSGMRARLGFAVAFLANPDVLLIDEILGVGDEEFRLKSAEAMTSLIKSNKTVVLVSHSLATIKSLCDRVVWINGGVVEKEGNVETVVQEYSDYVVRKRAAAHGIELARGGAHASG